MFEFWELLDESGASGATPPVDNPTPAASESGNAPEDKSGKTFTQAEVDKIITERLEREKTKAEKAAEKAKREAEEKALLDSKEFQTLAEKRAKELEEATARLSSLEQLEEKSKRYVKALTSYRDQLAANLPDSIKALLKDRDIADQLEWLAENAKTAQTPQFPATPNPNGQGLTNDEKRKNSFKVSL